MHTAAEIIEHFGGPQKLADTLGCSRTSIVMWRGFVPPTRAFEIQVRSGGRFTVDRMPLRKPIPNPNAVAA
jgi:hypothetical protein